MSENMGNGNKQGNEQIENNFTYHAPKEGQPAKYNEIRREARSLAYLIDGLCPHSREKSLAMTKLEEAVMWANASIAREKDLIADECTMCHDPCGSSESENAYNEDVDLQPDPAA
jgi:hypothetical protein